MTKTNNAASVTGRYCPSGNTYRYPISIRIHSPSFRHNPNIPTPPRIHGYENSIVRITRHTKIGQILHQPINTDTDRKVTGTHSFLQPHGNIRRTERSLGPRKPKRLQRTRRRRFGRRDRGITVRSHELLPGLRNRRRRLDRLHANLASEVGQHEANRKRVSASAKQSVGVSVKSVGQLVPLSGDFGQQLRQLFHLHQNSVDIDLGWE